ncbi:MAG: hypothetical protein ACRCX2_03840 [Paraclostridium sp.]
MRTRVCTLRCHKCNSKKIDLYDEVIEGNNSIFWIMIIIGIFLATVGVGVFLILGAFFFKGGKQTRYMLHCVGCGDKRILSEQEYYNELEDDRILKAKLKNKN